MDRAAAMELQRRCLAAFVRLVGRGSEGAALYERDGVLAAVVPACPDRSVINSVTYSDAASLGAALDELAAAHEEAGVRAWTVWVPEDDRDAAALLEAAGHRLDATPAAMVVDLVGLPDPDTSGLDWDDQASAADVARVNDHAYGFDEPTFGAALAAMPGDIPLRLYQARVDGEPASVLATVDEGDDCGIYLVGTLTEHRGQGLSGRLLHAALAQARDRGLRTSSLQATKLGYPVYERLGYEPICTLEMWERRKPE
jgi:GNAT superfamily N-acetyltransferase